MGFSGDTRRFCRTTSKFELLGQVSYSAYQRGFEAVKNGFQKDCQVCSIIVSESRRTSRNSSIRSRNEINHTLISL